MAEVKKSPRPKARPKGLGLSSTRPRSRPLSNEEGMARQEAAAVKQAQELNKEKEFEINSAEYDGKERFVIDFKDGTRLSAPEIESMLSGLKTASEPIIGSLTSKEIMNYLKENNPTREEFIKHFSSIKMAEGGDVKALGDLEFEATLAPLLKKDPIAMLGLKVSRARRYGEDTIRPETIHKLPESVGNKVAYNTYGNRESFSDRSPAFYDEEYDIVSYGARHGASLDVIIHELRHRGLKILAERYGNEEEFLSKYGEDSLKLLSLSQEEGSRNQQNEFVTELFDNSKAVYVAPNPTGSNTTEKMSDTIQFADPLSASQPVPDALDSLRDVIDIPEKDYRTMRQNKFSRQFLPEENVNKGKTGLKQAAVDLLNDVGVLGFNEGGDVMNRQMEMFAIGGLSDDGMTRDPVSGNDIPPGSMAEEVRDDIPAQLSEGEYVVPADVVRFFGVKYFEDLRMEAKMGLSSMEANGRIGGEPVPSGGPMAGPTESALTPEEMAVLSEMGMNVGGFVPQQQPPVQAIGNTQQGMNRGYAPGGSVTDFNPANYGLGYSVFGQPSGTTAAVTAPSTVALYSPDGVMRSLTLPAEQAEYDRLIAEGWSTGMTTETSVGKDDSDEDYLDGKGGGGNPIAEQSLESLELQLKNLQEGTGVAGFITGLIDESLLGKGIKALTGKSVLADGIARIQAEIASRAGVDGGGGTSADKGTFKPKGEGNTLAQKAAIQKSIDDYQAEAEKKKVQVTTSPASSSGGDDGDPFFEDTFTTTTDVGGHNVTERTYGDTTVGADEDGLNKGGFVSKRTKKKKK